MELSSLPLVLAATAFGCAGIVMGLAIAQARIWSLYDERNELWLKVDSQELKISELHRRLEQQNTRSSQAEPGMRAGDWLRPR